MQCYLKIEVLDLDGHALKSVHELFEELVVCQSQTGQGSQGHAVRPASGILALNRLTRVSKLSMDLGRIQSYQINATPLKDLGKTRHRIGSSLVQRLSVFHHKCMSASIMRSTKGCRQIVFTGRCTRERLKSSTVLPVRWGVWFPLGAFRQGVGGLLVAVGTSDTSLQLVMISLQLCQFFLIASPYLRDAGLELLQSVYVYHSYRTRMRVYEGGSRI